MIKSRRVETDSDGSHGMEEPPAQRRQKTPRRKKAKSRGPSPDAGHTAKRMQRKAQDGAVCHKTKVRGVPRSDEIEELIFAHALIESKYECEWAEYRGDVPERAAAGLTEGQLKYGWLVDNARRVAREADPARRGIAGPARFDHEAVRRTEKRRRRRRDVSRGSDGSDGEDGSAVAARVTQKPVRANDPVREWLPAKAARFHLL